MDITDYPQAKCDDRYADRIRSMQWYLSTQGILRTQIDGKWCPLHRLVWAWEYGWDSVPRYLTFRNGDRMDYRLANISPTTISASHHRNAGTGVFANPRSSKSPWGAAVSHKGTSVHLGSFATREEAEAVVAAAKALVVRHETEVACGGTPEPIDWDSVRRTRPKPPDLATVIAFKAAGLSCRRIAEETGCSASTISKMLKTAGVSLSPDKAQIPP